MSKPFTNPFFEADMSKLFDFSKISGDMKMPQFDMEAFTALQRKNMETYTALNQSIMETVQGIWQRQGEMARQMMEETTQSFQAVMSCPTPQEKLAKQAEASKATMEKCLANMRDIAETVSKCNTQAIETVSTRMNEGMNELRGIISTNKAA